MGRHLLGKVKRPVLFLGQSLVTLPTSAGARTPTALKMLKAYGANGALDPTAHGLAHCLNHFMQTILLGIPALPGVSHADFLRLSGTGARH